MDAEFLTGYEDEPKECFEDLPAEQGHLLYHYERLTHDLSAELGYYHTQLRGRCSRLLELGCGTGILASRLQSLGYQVTGIDLDRRALRHASGTTNCRLIQMDMCALALKPAFEAALIGQNTLNLLSDQTHIVHCLEEIRRVLVGPGLLLAHLHCSEADQRPREGERLMQFALFDHPEGGKIVKETIRSYDPQGRRLDLEQRYKIRRFSSELPDHNYRTFLSLAALSQKEWSELFASAGFILESVSSGFQNGAASSNSALHLVAQTSAPC